MIRVLAALVVALFALVARGESTCSNAAADVLQNVCLDCFFPIRVGVQTGSGGSGYLPDDKFAAPATVCPTEWPPFVTACPITGLWYPDGIVEVVRDGGCSPSLGGTNVGAGANTKGVSKNARDFAFYNAHYFPYPLGTFTSMMFAMTGCNFSATATSWASELDPSWGDPELSEMLYSSELRLVPMPIIEASCAAEALVHLANPEYTGTVPWCAGGYGHLVSPGGYLVSHRANPTMDAALTATKALHRMARMGLIGSTWGTWGTVCNGDINRGAYIPRTGIKLQQVYPVAEQGNHPIGRRWGPIFSLGSAKSAPMGGGKINEDSVVFIVWRYAECCAKGE